MNELLAFRRTQSAAIVIEYLFGIGVVLLLIRALLYVYYIGYLPQPFFYEAQDTYMDWFNTAYWAHVPGAYAVWNTIYPPLSFVFLKFVGVSACYAGFEAGDTHIYVRSCDWLGMTAIHAIFAINIILVAKTFIKIDRRTALPRSMAVACGMPMLFGLERGNLILCCFTSFLLAYGPLLKSARGKWIFGALSINFKVYLIAPAIALLLRRRWIAVEWTLVFATVIYGVTYVYLAEGTIPEIVSNIKNFSSGFIAANVLDVWYSATYRPMLSLLSGIGFPAHLIIGSKLADVGMIVFGSIIAVGQLSIILAAIATWLRPEVVPNHRVVFLGTAFALITSEAGGYTESLLLLLVMMEPWKGIARPVAIIAAYLLALPADIVVGYIPPLVRESFLAGGARVEVQFGVGLGVFLRPGIVVTLATALSAATIADVWRDIKTQGWSGRWRYRRDIPLLPTDIAPRAPSSVALGQ